MSTWSTSAWAPGDVTLPIHDDIMDSGVYTYKVEAFAYGQEQDYDLSSGCISEESAVFNYTRPSQQVAVPTNIKWDSTGIVSWDKVEHADHYWVYLYVKDEAYTWNDGYVPKGGYGSISNFYNFSDKLADGYEYYVRVNAESENINLYANGDYSEYIPFNKDAVTDNVGGKLDTVIPEVITPENVQDAVTDVKDSFKDDAAKSELQIAMQTDEATRDKIAALEEQYMASKGVETAFTQTEDVGIDAGSVSLLGAGLNATEAGSVTFNMSKPDEETQKDLITNTRFTKAIVLDLELEGAGIEKGQTLAIPVTVTMNPPAGIDIDKLTILHFNEDNSSYETLPVRLNSDGTISFTVTHFSNFLFGEKEQSQDLPSSGNAVTRETGTVYEVHNTAEEISKKLAQEAEELIRAEEAIPVNDFLSKEAVNALPTEIKEISETDTVYNLSKITTTQGFISAINKIAKADTATEAITVYGTKPIAFNTKLLTALTNMDRDFVYMFNHKGHLYQITIPADAEIELKGVTFAGPLYIGAQLGTSVLIK